MKYLLPALLLGAAALGLAVAARAAKEEKKVDGRVFELRTYHAAPGKMEALHARFRDHTCELFRKHGMTIVGFWSPMKPEEARKTLVYLLAFPSKEAADKSWAAFRKDPDWIKARDASEKDGPIVAKIESVFLNPTDYSAIK